MRIEVFTGDAIAPHVRDIGDLRITVFREYPYLYDGDTEYEWRYLQQLRNCPGAVVVGAFDGDRMVGASNGAPLTEHAIEFGQPFRERGYDLSKLFYFAESVLLEDYRGTGIGSEFYTKREDHARSLGCTHVALCTVVREDNHPDRPKDYVPMDGFWKKRGFSRLDGVMATFHWRDVGDAHESPHPLQFWIKEL